MVSVWVTRARPGADATAAGLVALGHAPLVAPVLEVRALAGPPLDLRGVAALAFTSANGVRAFTGRSPERGLPVFCVGAATAAAAQAAGFDDVASADGDVAALAALIVAQRAGLGGEVLHANAVVSAGDLAETLKAAGVGVRVSPLYETVVAPALPAEAEAALGAHAVEAVLAHSPRGAGALASLLGPADASTLRRVRALAISEAALAPLSHLPFARLQAAAQPDEPSLLALLA